MVGKEIYKIWAPVGTRWVDWVRPVPFVQIDETITSHEFFYNTIPTVHYIKGATKNTALVIDMPSYESVNEGIAVAKLGFRPIPIYNGVNAQLGAIATVDNTAIELSLIWGARQLKNTEIKNDAPPAFLLDSNRMNRFKMSDTVYDNSWDVYSQDLPTAEYFLNNGINKIIVRSDNIRKDLAKILYTYQKAGIKILHTEGYDKAKEVNIKKPKKKENN